MWGLLAIANQTQEQVEQDHSALLLVENSVSGVEIKAVHEGTCSAAPVPNPEKWSSRADRTMVPCHFISFFSKFQH
ncbi:hypothetical protein [Nostoc sp. C110]|uniref:hypothetical protein n=1 Tax=Nostoc sp. C110 TaxID=3349876 RepID=UPI00370D8213